MTTNFGKLYEAVRQGNLQLVDNLIQCNEDVNGVYYGMTPLLVAITSGHEEIAARLIAKGCDVTKSDVQNTMVPFQEAVTRCQVKVVQAITNAGKNKVKLDEKLNKSIHTPLTFACENGYTQLANVLIQAGASVSLENGHKESPLYIAAKEGWVDICQSLLKSGAPKDTSCGEQNQSPLIGAVLNDHEDVVKLLLKASCAVNNMDNNGNTPLWYAVTGANLDITKLLVQFDADVHHKDTDGLKILDIAKQDDQEDIIEVLSKGGQGT